MIFKIKKGIRYYDHQPTTKEQLRTLKYDDDWNYQKEGDKITDSQEVWLKAHALGVGFCF